MKLHVLRALRVFLAAVCVLHTGCSRLVSGALYSTLGRDPMHNTYLEVYVYIVALATVIAMFSGSGSICQSKYNLHINAKFLNLLNPS